MCFDSEVTKFGSQKLYSNNKTYQGNNCQPFVNQSRRKRNWFWNAISFQSRYPIKNLKKKKTKNKKQTNKNKILTVKQSP